MMNHVTSKPVRLAPLLLGALLCASALAQTQDYPRDSMAPTGQTTPAAPPVDDSARPATPALDDSTRPVPPPPAAAGTQAVPAVQDATPGVTPPAVAQQQKKEIAHGDPSRWYQNDSTAADQLRTVRKEIAAALQEATLACRKQPAAERTACMKEARDTYRRDMVNAKAIRDENNRLE
ncbi:MAG TPA: hypothetical protein VFT05_06265 [Burkholderiaceae bacterium]|nr:hypothetical protein [Burkholderiaceae bacterium]